MTIFVIFLKTVQGRRSENQQKVLIRFAREINPGLERTANELDILFLKAHKNIMSHHCWNIKLK